MRHYSLRALSILLLSLGSGTYATAQTVYGLSTQRDDTPGIYSYELCDTGVTNKQLVQKIELTGDDNSRMYQSLAGGIYVNGKYYYVRYTQTMSGYQSDGFWEYDFDSKTSKQVKNLGSTDNGPIFGEEEYDYQTGTMYCGNSPSSVGDKLQILDPATGNTTVVGTFTFDRLTENAQQYPDFGESLVALAMNYDGEMYGVSYWGGLYKVDKETAACTLVGALDYLPGNALQYAGAADLFFDNNTDKLYLYLYQHPSMGGHGSGAELVSIDPTTAHVTPIKVLPSLNDLLQGNTVTFKVAEASAPQKAQNFTVKAGEQGTLSATLEWDNPSKTYGRGGTLEDLDSMIIYRNGVEIHRIANPTIGGHETYTDQVPARGYYNYRLVGVNDMGHGDRVTTGAYIGTGDPQSVTNLSVKNEIPNAVISWTAPTKGKQDAYIDTTALTYDIMRLPDSTQVASDVKGCSFTDTTIHKLSKYQYRVVAKADGYSSAATVSETAILGPAIEVPDTLLAAQENFDLWKTVDADGDYTSWTWQAPSSWSFGGAYAGYNYTDFAPANWLISPYIHLLKDKHYKITFLACPNNKKVTEQLSIGFGKGQEIAEQDSINNFLISGNNAHTLRSNLPVVSEDGNYYFSFLQRTPYAYFGLYLKNVVIGEDHEGYISGKVTAEGKAVAGATVTVNGGEFNATTDAEGNYKLYYLPEGTHTVNVTALGYENTQAQASVTEYETTQTDIALTALPTYTISGEVKDIAGDAVSGADVEISGYNAYSASTDANGKFSISGVYKNDYYAISVTKNKLKSHTANFKADSDQSFSIVLRDDIRPASHLAAAVDTANANTVNVTWNAPANDAVVNRIDDGTLTTTVGLQSGTNKSVFGVINRTPSLVSGIQYYIAGTSSTTHYSVAVRIFDLDKDGNPTSNLLYENTYVPCTDDQWNTYTLPAAIDAPRGYFATIASNGFLGIGIDGDGDSQKYPFKENTNCFASDYTTGQFGYLESQSSTSLHHNILLRTMAAPYTVAEDSLAAKAPRFIFSATNATADNAVLDSHNPAIKQLDAPAPLARKVIQQRVRYNVYRMKTTDEANESAWTLLSEKQASRSYADTQWGNLEKGVYAYAVKTVYTGDTLSTAVISDSIGNKMSTTVKIHAITNTPDNEAYGAKVVLINGGGKHYYEATLDDNGEATISNVWKTNYEMHVTLDGFSPVDSLVNLSDDDSYSFTLNLTEKIVKPYNLIIEKGSSDDARTFIWNYENCYADDFEGHTDFAINSPGLLGWQYIDGDGAETGAFNTGSDSPWPNAFQPMAFIVFNPYEVKESDGSTLVDYYSSLRPHSGQKALADWGTTDADEDDWLITPKLHFTKDFKYRFYANSADPWGYPEQLEVLYSTTTAEPSAFTRIDSLSVESYYSWLYREYDIPADAKYVALRAVTKAGKSRCLLIDDVAFGYADALPATPSYMPARHNAVRRMPSLDGAYEVYLDGVKVAQQDETEYEFTNLSVGKHTAGVKSSYTSGESTMSTIEFTVSNTDGIEKVTTNGNAPVEYYNINGQKVGAEQAHSGVYLMKQGNRTTKKVIK